MKKKLLSAVLCMSMAAALLTGCGKKEDTPAPAKTQDQDAGNETPEDAQEPETEGSSTGERTTLTVGFDAEFPPYGYKDESGEYVGVDLSLAQEVCDRLGWELVKQPIAWDSKDMELASGAIDCIWNGFTMNGREDQYEFTDPYIDKI